MSVPSRNQKPKVVSVRPPGASSAPPVRAFAPPSKRPAEPLRTDVEFDALGDLMDLMDLGDAQVGRRPRPTQQGARRFTRSFVEPEESDAIDDLFAELEPAPVRLPPFMGDTSAPLPSRLKEFEGTVIHGSAPPGPKPRPEIEPDRTSVELPFNAPQEMREALLGIITATADIAITDKFPEPVAAPRRESLLARARAAAVRRREAKGPKPWSRANIAAVAASVVVSGLTIAFSFHAPSATQVVSGVNGDVARPSSAERPLVVGGQLRQATTAPDSEQKEAEASETEPETNSRAGDVAPRLPTAKAPARRTMADGILQNLPKGTAAFAPRCQPQGNAMRVARAVDPQVPVELRVVNDQVIIGLATTSEVLGLSWVPGTAQAEVRYQAARQATTGVIPLDGANGAVFAVDDAQSFGVTQGRTLASRKRWVVGTVGDSLAAASIDGGMVELWKIPAGTQVGRPDVAAFDAKRQAIAFRMQARPSVVRFGVFDIAARKRWGFAALPITGRDVGRPAVASNGKYAAVAAAVAPASGEPWRIQTALLSRDGELLLHVPLAFLPYPRFVDQISPKIAPLGAKSWILQWTEGEALARKVQVITLDDNLQPVGEPRSISPARVNAGGGQIVTGDINASLYLSQTADKYDAWIQQLDCH